MALSIKHKLVGVIGLDLPIGVVGLDEVAVLEHLGEPEALLEVLVAAAVGRVDVVDGAVAASDAARLVDSEEGVPGPFLVLCVARGPVGVVVALDDLGPEHVVGVVDPEPRRFVELGLVGRRRAVVGRVGREPVVLPPERLGPDTRGRRRVRVVARHRELDAEVDVLLLVEREAAQDDFSSVEASH